MVVHPQPAQGRSRAAPATVVAVMAYCGSAVALMQTLVLPLLPQFPELLKSSASTTSWMATSSLVAGAVCTPVLGRLGDMVGKRRMVLVSLAAMLAGSLLGAVSTGIVPLLIARTMQGASSGVIPIGISIIRDELPPERVGGGIALVSATMGIGGGLGLPLAGVLVENFDWHAVFWVSVAISIVAIALVFFVVPESPVRTPARFDVLGAAGLSVVLVALLLAISKGADWGWLGRPTLASLGVAGLTFALWSRYERRVKDPLVDLVTSTRRPILLTNIASTFVGFSMFANFLGAITVVQLPKTTGHGFEASLVVAGLCLLPGTVAMIVLSPMSARLSAARSPRTTIIVGSLIVAAGYVLRIVLYQELWQLVVGSLVVQCGVAFSFGALPAMIMANVPDHETAAANSLNALSRSLGTSTASAASSAIMGAITVTVAGIEYPGLHSFTVLYALAIVASLAAVLLARAIPVPAPASVIPLPEGAVLGARAVGQ